MPHIDKNDFHWFMGVKLLLMVLSFKMFSIWIAIGLIIVFAVFYREVIAKIKGIHAMEIGDLNTFYTSPKALTNVMSVTTVTEADPNIAKEIFSRITKAHMKARSRIVKVLNDMYYKEMDEDEVLTMNIEYLPDGQVKT